jgi:hypothetical protein
MTCCAFAEEAAGIPFAAANWLAAWDFGAGAFSVAWVDDPFWSAAIFKSIEPI